MQPKRVEELPNGVVVYQVTDDDRPKDNIYCETPFCPPDSSWFLYRRPSGDEASPSEFFTCNLRTWEHRSVGRGASAPIITRSGAIYWKQRAGDWTLVRMDSATWQAETIQVDSRHQPRCIPTISPDERYAAYGVALSFDPQMFAIERADLRTGQTEIIDEDPEISNPHGQYEPGEGRLIMVQHNRGCVFSADGKSRKWQGDLGATLYVVDTADGTRTPLAVGKPHTAPVTGHETWIGTTGEIVFTTITTKGEPPPPEGNVYAVRPGAAARILSPGCLGNHVGATPCGRYFTVDRHNPDQIAVGSTRTGRWAYVCTPGASWTNGQQSHPHAYLTPDTKWVIFDSDRTGRTEIYAASVPPELIAELKV